MQIILMEKVTNLGQLGDIVNVKSGFARNYRFRKERQNVQPNKPLRNFNPNVPNLKKFKLQL